MMDLRTALVLVLAVIESLKWLKTQRCKTCVALNVFVVVAERNAKRAL